MSTRIGDAPARAGVSMGIVERAGHALQAGHVEHALHAVNNPWSIGSAATRAAMPLLAVPTIAYFAGRELLEDHPRGDKVATNAALGLGGAIDGLFEHKGLLHEHARRVVPHAVTSAHRGSKLLAGAGTVAGVLGKAIPGAIAIGGGLTAAHAVRDSGGDASALVHTHDGREGVLRSLGGALLLAPMPWCKLAGAGVFLLAAANDHDMLEALDRPFAPTKSAQHRH